MQTVTVKHIPTRQTATRTLAEWRSMVASQRGEDSADLHVLNLLNGRAVTIVIKGQPLTVTLDP